MKARDTAAYLVDLTIADDLEVRIDCVKSGAMRIRVFEKDGRYRMKRGDIAGDEILGETVSEVVLAAWVRFSSAAKAELEVSS